MKADYGELISPDNALIMDSPDPGAAPSAGDQASSDLLWEYHSKDTINDIKIREGDRRLAVDTEDLLVAAYKLDRRPRSVLFLLSPEGGDNDKYSELLERAHNNEIVVVSEQSQYDQSKGGFIVWVQYDELEYQLKPRFAYLKEEQG